VRKNDKWVRSTIYTVPANSIVHVTLYQYDGNSGLRNPFLSQVQGTVGGTETVDGKTINSINPEEASHTFVIPQLGVFVPLPGVPEEAKNTCEFAPCEGATHRTITFSFKTGKKGRYRWQCFVPCAAGTIDGFSDEEFEAVVQILMGARGYLSRQQAKDESVFVGRPHGAIDAQERCAGAFLTGKSH